MRHKRLSAGSMVIARPFAVITLLIMASIAGSAPAHAVDPDEQLDNPVLEARAREISRILRCVVCKSQSIDDSDAPLAKDLRLLVRERLVAGDSDEAVIEFVTERYGDYVLLKPRLTPATLLLWTGPFLVLAIGGTGAYRALRRSSGRAGDTVASPTTEKTSAEQTSDDEAFDNTGLV